MWSWVSQLCPCDWVLRLYCVLSWSEAMPCSTHESLKKNGGKTEGSQGQPTLFIHPLSPSGSETPVYLCLWLETQSLTNIQEHLQYQDWSQNMTQTSVVKLQKYWDQHQHTSNIDLFGICLYKSGIKYCFQGACPSFSVVEPMSGFQIVWRSKWWSAKMN